MQTVSQGQWYNLYDNVNALRCDPLMTQDENPTKEFLTVKLQPTGAFYQL